MEKRRFASTDSLWRFLDELKYHLRAVRGDQKALILSLRRTCEYFNVDEGCIAVLTPDGSRADVISVVPGGGQWDLDHLAAFLQKRRPNIPPNIIMVPVNRRDRVWAVLAILEKLRPQDLFYEILHGLRSLTNYDHSSALLIYDRRENVLELVAEQIAWLKGKSRRIGLKLPLNHDVRSRIDHKRSVFRCASG